VTRPRYAILALAAWLVLPATAAASTAGVSADGELSVVGSPGEANRLTVTFIGSSPAGDAVFITDNGPGIQAGANCFVSGSEVVCKGIENVSVSLGDRADGYADSGLDLPVTISGGDGDDRITTRASARRAVQAGDGADVVRALGMSRRPAKLVGEDGNDHLEVIQGKGNLTGGSGNDELLGGKLKDNLTGGNGRDAIRGRGGADRLVGEGGIDLLVGGGGTDFFKSGAGSDQIRSRDGRAETVDCTAGNDQVRADRVDRLRPSCGPRQQPGGDGGPGGMARR